MIVQAALLSLLFISVNAFDNCIVLSSDLGGAKITLEWTFSNNAISAQVNATNAASIGW